MNFYKFKKNADDETLEQVDQMVCSDGVYFSAPDTFNDVFDLKPVFDLELKNESQIEAYRRYKCVSGTNIPSNDPRLEFLREKIRTDGTFKLPGLGEFDDDTRKIGVSCLTQKIHSPTMWGHYSGNGKGFALEYDIQENRKGITIHEVIYSPMRPIIDTEILFMSKVDQQGLNKLYEKCCLTKYVDWGFEKEWRLINPLANSVLVKNLYPITKIIVGPKMDDREIEMIKSRFSGKVDIAYAKLSEFEYEIVF